MLTVALPKGRLGDKAYDLFEKAGLGTPDFFDSGRKLISKSDKAGISFILVKPWDVPIYVERGVADIGVAGRDTILESAADVYELADLGIGRCRMAVAGPEGHYLPQGQTLRVATKYTAIAKSYYSEKRRPVQLIKLNGSVELAPLLGLSDLIVDIVETGGTLRENGLCILEEILPVSARLIANKAGFKFKEAQIMQIAQMLTREAQK